MLSKKLQFCFSGQTASGGLSNMSRAFALLSSGCRSFPVFEGKRLPALL